MSTSLLENGATSSNRVILAVSEAELATYLRAVLEFIDCEVFQATTLDDVLPLLKVVRAQTVTLMISNELDRENRDQILDGVGSQKIKPAIIQVQASDVQNMMVSGNVLGMLSVPTHCDAVISLLHRSQVYWENQLLEKGIAQRPVELFRSLSGNSRATQAINQMIKQVADTEATVLILGESGTGKEVVARKLHFQSKRHNKPFVPVNCGAIPGDLLESELFGHEKGAFTGAISTRKGRFELAENGTLFLDEIGDMSMQMQVKLLRVLQERTFERVGSNKTLKANVRIIAATHRHLEKSIEDGTFREDLFYRLNVFPIDVQPLRERKDDIPILIADLIQRMENENRGSVNLTPAATTVLQLYSWPGNVRELANLIERLVILFPHGMVDVQDLPERYRAGVDMESYKMADRPVGVTADVSVIPDLALPEEGMDLKEHLSAVEKSLIQQALDESGGVVAHAAKKLNMRRTTLVEKLKKYDLQRQGTSDSNL